MSKVKLSDFLGNIFKNLGLDEKSKIEYDLILAASALRDVELPEEAVSKFDSVYLTSDRAENELGPKLMNKYKAENFGQFAAELERNSLKAIVDGLPSEYQEKIKGLSKTNKIYGIIDVINEAMNNIKTNGSTDDVKKISEKHRQAVEELNKKILDQDALIKNKEAEFESAKGQIKTDFALRGKIGSFKLAPEFEKRKDFITDLTLNSLKSKGFLVELDKENSQVLHLRQNKDGAIQDVYEGNTKVTLDAILEKELGDFIQKSNGSGGTPPGGTPPSTHSVKLPTDRHLTLAEMRHAAAQSEG